MSIKYIFISLFILISSYVEAQESVGFFIDENDKKVLLYTKPNEKIKIKYNYIINDDVNLTGQLIYYYNKSGDLKKIFQSKVKEMTVNKRIFKNLPITKSGAKRLHEVLISNNDYMITNYFFKGNYFYIFKVDGMIMVEKKTRHSSKRKNDYKSLDKIINRYFSNCATLMNGLKNNIKNSDYKMMHNGVITVKNNLFKGYSNYKCN